MSLSEAGEEGGGGGGGWKRETRVKRAVKQSKLKSKREIRK